MKFHALTLCRKLEKYLGIYEGCPRIFHGAEIGVFRGETSEGLLKRYPQLLLTMVDSGWGIEFRNKFEPEDVEAEARSRVAFAEGRYKIITEKSPDCAANITNGLFDFVFIDADHTYEGVKADIDAWWPKVAPNGVLAGHDYGGRLDQKGKFGVSRAVDEFAADNKLEIDLGRSHIWVIHKYDPLSAL